MGVIDIMDAKGTSSLGNPNPNILTPHPSKSSVAIRFLRVLSLVRHTASSSPSSRACRIRRAACSCMAYSAGPRRAWSRALLRKLVRRRRKPPRRDLPRPAAIIRRRRPVGGDRLEVALRRVVPGGAGMEYCRLLEEAADYVKCLVMQVRLMQSIVDFESHVHSVNKRSEIDPGDRN
ncbi:transcription factor IBH1-like [Zingiber officinale]|uniref:transcription factor IBH1-like n=1 Tax=Zingiber officinale TaxID=94328 RepID=UPI001C4BD0E3|nr:transcription factor IBH1-like [Zingiber officinale]